MLVVVSQSSARIFAEPSEASAVVAEVPAGEILDLRPRAAGAVWIPVFQDGRQIGYVSSDAPVVEPRPATLVDDHVSIRSTPEYAAPAMRRLKVGQKVSLMDTVSGDGVNWTRVRDEAGAIGFVPPGTRFQSAEPPKGQRSARAAAQRSMLIGAAWCVGGLAITGVTYAAASDGGGSYLIAWGPALFGGLQFVRGAFAYFSAKS